MAQPTNQYDTYDIVGAREDLGDTIDNVTPEATPFYSSAGRADASNTYHEWQTDSYRSSEDNAKIEGDDKVAVARTPTVRLGNYTQIIDDTINVSGTQSAVKKAGRNDEMDYQVVKAGVELRKDAEKALLNNKARVAGNSATARELAGVPAWLTSNTSKGAGSGADPTGDGTDARTDGTQRNFTQTLFDGVMQSIWTNSDGGTLTALLNAFQMNKALGFAGNNNQRAQIAASKNEVRNVIDIYMTPWGQVEFVGSRECRARDALVLDMEKWKVATLRGMYDEPLAKTGDSEQRLLGMEITLEACNEASSGGVFDLSTS